MSDLDASDDTSNDASNENTLQTEPTQDEDITEKLLNNRGLPARKRKMNSLIFGMDEKISIPVKKAVKAKGTKVPKKTASDSTPATTTTTKTTAPNKSIPLKKALKAKGTNVTQKIASDPIPATTTTKTTATNESLLPKSPENTVKIC